MRDPLFDTNSNAQSSSSVRPVRSAGLERSRLATRLRRTLRGEVLFDAGSRARYSTDASIYQIEPVGVVVPADEEDVQATLDLANEMNVPVLARGGGTSQCGQTVGEALVIDTTKHLRNLIAVDAQAGVAEVQPGMVLDHLNAALKAKGWWFAVDVSTAAQATLGGMAGNNSCGSRSLAYGNMVHNVLGIDAILADGTQEFFGPFGAKASRPMRSARTGQLVSDLFSIGQRESDEIKRMWPTVMRRVGGYNLDVFEPRSERPYTTDNSVNLAHLLVGSEGTLAWTRRLHLKLARLPLHKRLGVVNFASFHRAMDSAQHIVKLGPVAVELVDRTMIDLARFNPAFKQVIETALVDPSARTPEAILLVEFSGQESGECDAGVDRLVELMGDLGLPGTVVAMRDETHQKALWEVRKAGLNIMMSLKGDGKPVSFIEDCAVPLEHLAQYTDALTEVFARHGTRGTWYAHASVGTLHVRPILDMRQAGEQGGAAKMRHIAEEAALLVRKYKGAFSGEHGDGLVRSEWVGWQFGERLTRAFEEVKDKFDPKGLMNPGKIVRATKMDEASLFRFKPGYQATPLTTALDWSAWNVQNHPVTEAISAPGTGGDPAQGLAKAVEMCNNNGHCRKFDAGTMCPSYRISRDEQHLTRGRANTLRMALTGQLDDEGIASTQVKAAMDLCVGCKGCKRDCPTGVDMARMKIEVAHHWHQKHGWSLRDKLVAYLPRYAAWGARLAPLLNLRNRISALGWLGEKVLGFSAQRQLPHWSGRSFFSEQPINSEPSVQANGLGEVVLWVDTFNNVFDPQILDDAQAVLQSAGYRVVVARSNDQPQRPLCCGRTYLSTGMVERAREEALRTMQALLPHVERGATIVGLEPSCLLSLRDEHLALRLGEQAERIAGASMLFEEFLDREMLGGKLDGWMRSWQSLPTPALHVHGHCHQKALDAFAPVLRVLKRIPQVSVQVIESSCCGMAGAFGYEAEHVQASRAMAELSLLPAVRKADEAAWIVADGTSCRHQIEELGERKVRHVATVLRALLKA